MNVRLGLGGCAMALFFVAACDDAPSPPSVGAHAAAEDTARLANVVDCASVTPTADVAWSASSANVEVNVAVGQIVRWRDADGQAHTVTSGVARVPAGLFAGTVSSASPVLCVRFNGAGDFPFFCQDHSTAGSAAMTGTVHVR